ncbi:MAG: hypothetical protein A2W19_10825 [Spirochaetes bacterium RBG_16_49_21]|nr:MAG: hypothetical protein A2W19_10825 [Spirochaetes bacterium RBG_16_49_21]
MNRVLYQTYENELADIKKRNAHRHLKSILSRDGRFVTYEDKRLLNLSSNDYLGFASDRRMHQEFYRHFGSHDPIDSFGLGASSSRLLTGDHSLYTELESTLSGLYSENAAAVDHDHAGKQALVFSSGYHANTGILPALAGAGDLICSDELNHASIIDGIRLSRAEYIVYGHLDYDELVRSLTKKRGSFRNVVIATESVFSMDGDVADLKRLVGIKNNFNALLYVDEAHAVGVFGDAGLGICERDGVIADVDVIVATFGKALGSVGGYAVTAPILREYLINRVRPFIFSTALPPVIINWNLFTLREMKQCRTKREQLMRLSETFRAALAQAGCATGGQSQIVPVIFGDNDRSIQAAEALLKRGCLVFPIRPPSVPEGGARIRISLRADMEWDDLKEIPDIVRAFM